MGIRFSIRRTIIAHASLLDFAKTPRNLAPFAIVENRGEVSASFIAKFFEQNRGRVGPFPKNVFRSEITPAHFSRCAGGFANFAPSFFTVISLSAFGLLNRP